MFASPRDYVREPLHVGILPPRIECPLPAPRETAPESTASKKTLEEIAELLGTGESASVEFEPLVPVRRRAKVLTGLPIGAELVVGGTFFRVSLPETSYRLFRLTFPGLRR